MTDRYQREDKQRAPGEPRAVLVEVDAAMLPLVLSAVAKYHSRAWWASQSDYAEGYPRLLQLQRALLTPMTEPIVTAIDRLYRLLDSALNGTEYAVAPESPPDEPVVTPAIPAAPALAPAPSALAARSLLARLWQLAENSGTGATFANAALAEVAAFPLDDGRSWRERLLELQGETGGFFGFGAQPVTLRDLLQASRINTPADEGLIADGFQEVLQTAAQGGNIAQAAAQFLGIAADAATDGGLAAMQLVTALAVSASAGAQAGQLDRLTAELSMLNRALHGADAALGNTTPGRSNILPETLYATTQNGAGELEEFRGLAGLVTSSSLESGIRRAVGDTNVEIVQRLAQLRELLRTDVQSDTEFVSVADWAKATTAASQELVTLVNQGTPPGTVLSLLSDIRSALRTLAGLEAGGIAVEGSALRALLEQLECICEGVNGAPGGVPEYAPAACEPTATLGLTSIEGTVGRGETNLTWVINGGVGGLLTLVIPDPFNKPPGDYTAVLSNVSGPREICVQMVSDNPASVDLPTLTFEPYVFDGSVSGGRPVEQVGEGSNSITLWGQDTNDQFIGYVVTISPGGTTFADTWRVYLAYGPVG